MANARRVSSILCLLTLAMCASARAASRPMASADRSTFGVGLNYLGGHLRYRFHKNWMAEARYLTGKESADAGDVTAQVLGLRGYRFLGPPSRFQLFLGAEAASITARQQVTDSKTSGFAAGGFGGVEYRLARRLALEVDGGPYYVSSKEKTSHVSDSSVEFVLNSSIIFYLF